MSSAKHVAWCLTVFVAVGLGGCFTRPAARPEMAVFDLGDVNRIATPLPWLGTLDVTAPSWLDSRTMQYRLAAEPARRQNYAEHRWAANPSELLAVALRRQLGAGAGGEGCRLRVELDEWVQSFDVDGNSIAQVAFRATLLSMRGDSLIARQSFSAKSPSGRDAKQGVAAIVSLERQLAVDLSQWLIQQGREQKDIVARCRS